MGSCTGEEVTDPVFLPIDVILLAAASWVTVVVAQHDLKWKKATAFQMVDNSKFWVYTLYVVAILLTAGRYFLVGCTELNPDYVSIIYNWAASLIVGISCILPGRLFLLDKMRAVDFEKGNLKYCLCTTVALVLPLVITAVLLTFEYASVKKMLLVWRVIFTVMAGCEITILTCLLSQVKATTSSLPKSFVYCFSGTLWMRVGIVGSIVLKQTGVLDKRFLKVVHMAFIITGFVFYYHRQLSGKMPLSLRKTTTKSSSNRTSSLSSKGSKTDSRQVHPSSSGVSSTSSSSSK